MDSDQFNTILRVQETLRQEIQANHERMSKRVEESGYRLEGRLSVMSAELLVKLEAHQRDDDAMEKRLTIIETQRESEKQAVLKRGSMVALGVTLVIEGGKMIFEWVARKP
jgi:hypothetical protein